MIDFDTFINEISKIEQKEDGSYIIIKNNMPYHIPDNDEYRLEYETVKKYISENNIDISLHTPQEHNIIDNNKEEYIRAKRDIMLNEADIILMKYQEQTALGLIKESNEYYTSLLQYKQNLRDITKQIDFPENVIFPVMPEYS